MKNKYLKSLNFRFFLIASLFFFKATQLEAQQTYSKEIGLISDNDLYISTYYDRYYTNGTFLYFKSLAKTSRLKKIREFKIGHQMYTPEFASSHTLQAIDRPYAGYIYARYSQLFFSDKNYGLKSSFELGLLGPDAKAQELQNTIHAFYGFEDAEGWQYQINNTLGINMQFLLLKPFSKSPKKRIDFTSSSTLQLGTIFSELTTSIYTRINLFSAPLTNYSNTILFGSNLNHKKGSQKKELFIFIKPQIGYALYNATIQGSLFNNNEANNFDVNSFIYEIEIGIKYAIKRFDLAYSFIKYSKKTQSIQQPTNNYGSIQIAFKLN